MKILVSAACVLLLLGAGASAQTLDDLKRDGNGGSTDNILTYGMGYHQQRYSPLKEINKQTVNRLVPVWNLSLDNNWGEQAQPLIYNGVMYVTNARATVAIDVSTGVQLWKTPVNWVPETPRVVCCGAASRSRREASPATRPGRRIRTPGSMAAARPGSPAPTTPSSISRIGAPA